MSFGQEKLETTQNAKRAVHHTIILDSATNSAYGTISKDMSIIQDYDSII